jgi:hypothetical protein
MLCNNPSALNYFKKKRRLEAAQAAQMHALRTRPPEALA